MNTAVLGAYSGPGDNECAGPMTMTAIAGTAPYGDTTRVSVSFNTFTVTADPDGGYTVSPNGTIYFPGNFQR